MVVERKTTGGAEARRRAGETARLARGTHPAAQGRGAILQRDYWGVLDGCRLAAPEIGDVVAARFPDFPPPELVRFRRADGAEGPLRVGDELDVEIPAAGTFGVRVVHRDSNSLTIATLVGHPEAGKITFGAYPNPRGEVVFHIRSRARSGSRTHLLGFLVAGDPMQTNVWTEFINRLAAHVGEGVRDVIHAGKREVEESFTDTKRGITEPTFHARGG